MFHFSPFNALPSGQVCLHEQTTGVGNRALAGEWPKVGR